MGTYIHGLFDSKAFTMGLVAGLGRDGHSQGADCDNQPVAQGIWSRESEYDRLALAVRQSVDMDRVYAILKQGTASRMSAAKVERSDR